MTVSESYGMVMQAVTTTNQDRARAFLLKALEQDPHSKLACFHLGVLYAGRGLHEDSIACYRRIIEQIDETDAGVWFLLSRQYHLNGQLDEAKGAYLKTLELDPLCEKACMYIANILIRQGGNGNTAVQFAEKALALRTDTSMVKVEVFEETLAHARRLAAGSTGDDSGATVTLPSDLRRARLGDLVALGPDVAAVLDNGGIRCAGCAGYEDEALDRAAAEVGADLEGIVTEVGNIIARRRDAEPFLAAD